MKPITYSTTVEVSLTVEQLAGIVAHLGSDEQAQLISYIAEITGGPDYSEAMQLQYITEDPGLTREGRSLMEQIGNYAQPERIAP
jgi:hypothetical protein